VKVFEAVRVKNIQHTDCDLRHGADSLPKEPLSKSLWCGSALNVDGEKEVVGGRWWL